uniref:ANK_REP_REGION domain-containing protein n=1 Tax=Macrostomum lignano TaxID=282301 RepID=A0A1I8G8D2_9PLAT
SEQLIFRDNVRNFKIWDVNWQLKNGNLKVNSPDARGRTALTDSAWLGYAAMSELLIRHSAEVNAIDAIQTSPLHRAAWNGHAATVWILLKNGANPNLPNGIGRTPLHASAGNGHVDCVKLLLDYRADSNYQDADGWSPLHEAAMRNRSSANVIALDNSGSSPLHYAVTAGNQDVVSHLLKSGCNPNQCNVFGFTPVRLAVFFGLTNILAQLVSYKEPYLAFLLTKTRDRELDWSQNSDERAFSQELHEAMNAAGFVTDRARVMAAVVNCEQDILRARWKSESIYIVGSYAECWGNNRSRMNGTTDLKSDVDIVDLNRTALFHVKEQCQCTIDAQHSLVAAAMRKHDARNTFEYFQGHLCISGISKSHADFEYSTSKPAQSWDGFSILRPATDLVQAFKLCTYPRIQLLEPGYTTQIPEDIIEQLKCDLKNYPYHVVKAAPPGEEGKKCRGSAAFLENRLLRSMTTVQGQVYSVIKDLVKEEISKRAIGLRSYHAKTLMFQLLDKIPRDDWKVENFIKIVRIALEMLRTALLQEPQSSKCMSHFFFRDAPLYLKIDHNEKSQIAEAVAAIEANLIGFLRQFKDQLQPLVGGGNLVFHPFMLVPDPSPPSLNYSRDTPLYYYEVYTAVRDALLSLSSAESRDVGHRDLLRNLSKIPDFARIARETLKALALLDLGKNDEAKKILRACLGHQVSKGVPISVNDPSSDPELLKESVKRHLESVDSAWMFCFVFNKPLQLSMLPEYARQLFPKCILYVNVYYLNFNALFKFLCLDQSIVNTSTSAVWFEDSLQSHDSQEVLTTLEFCRDTQLKAKLIRRAAGTMADQINDFQAIWALLAKDPELIRVCTQLTIDEAVARVRRTSPEAVQAGGEQRFRDCQQPAVRPPLLVQ